MGKSKCHVSPNVLPDQMSMVQMSPFQMSPVQTGEGYIGKQLWKADILASFKLWTKLSASKTVIS